MKSDIPKEYGHLEPPRGWVIRSSRSRPGQICYMNIATRKRQFKRPKPVPEPSSNNHDSGSTSSEALKTSMPRTSDHGMVSRNEIIEAKDGRDTEKQGGQTRRKLNSQNGHLLKHRKTLESKDVQEIKMSETADKKKIQESPDRSKTKSLVAKSSPWNSKSQDSPLPVSMNRNVGKDAVEIKIDEKFRNFESRRPSKKAKSVRDESSVHNSKLPEHQIDVECPPKTHAKDKPPDAGKEQTIRCYFDNNDYIGERVLMNRDGMVLSDSLFSAVILAESGKKVTLGTVVAYTPKESPKFRKIQSPLGIVSTITLPSSLVTFDEPISGFQFQITRLYRLTEVGLEGSDSNLLMADKPSDWIVPCDIIEIPTVSFSRKTRRTCDFHCAHVLHGEKQIEFTDALDIVSNDLRTLLLNLIMVDGDDAKQAAESDWKGRTHQSESITGVTRIEPNLKPDVSASIPLRHNSLAKFRILDETTWAPDTVDWRLSKSDHAFVN